TRFVDATDAPLSTLKLPTEPGPRPTWIKSLFPDNAICEPIPVTVTLPEVAAVADAAPMCRAVSRVSARVDTALPARRSFPPLLMVTEPEDPGSPPTLT